jgi:hypothetical protein
VERLKGEKSFYEPFISYLPKEIQTLYTYPDDTKIGEGFDTTLIDEIQNKEDDIFSKIAQDREHHRECKERFVKFINEEKSRLTELTKGEIDFS